MLTTGARQVPWLLWPWLLRMCRMWLRLLLLLLLLGMLLMWARWLLHGGVHGGRHGVHGGPHGGGSRRRVPRLTLTLPWLPLLLLLLQGRWLGGNRRHQRSSRALWDAAAAAIWLSRKASKLCHLLLQMMDARTLNDGISPSSHQTGLSLVTARDQVADVGVMKLLHRRKLGMADKGRRWCRGKDKRRRSRNRRCA